MNSIRDELVSLDTNEFIFAKKGDAVIAAHLEAVGVRYFISENRHFLTELPDLPFQVLSSEQAVLLLS